MNTIKDLMADCLLGKYPNNVWVSDIVKKWKERAEKDVNLIVGCSLNEYQVLHSIIKAIDAIDVLEVGAGSGASAETFCHALWGSKIASLTQVDMTPPENCQILLSNRNFISFFQMKSQDFFRETHVLFDVIFIDADHTYEGAKADIEAGAKKLRPQGVLLAHDINHPGTEYIGDIVVATAKDHGREAVLLKNTGGHGLGVIL